MNASSLSSSIGKSFISSLAALSAFASVAGKATDEVDVFIGTSGNGHAFPAAAYPFGLVQAGPDTGNGSWDYCAGYRYEDKTIDGFSQTHLCGTGRGEMGDLLILPYAGESLVRKTRLDHAGEAARPGYYSLKLPDAGCAVEIAAAGHSAIYRIRYDRAPARLLLDLQHGITSFSGFVATHVLSNRVAFAADGLSLSGTTWRRVNFPEHSYSYQVAFDRAFHVVEELPRAEGEKASRYVLGFDLKPGETLTLKLALSLASPAAATANLGAEIPDWDLARVRAAADAAWENYLSRIEIAGRTKDRIRFYSALYRTGIQPNNIADVPDRCYSTLSLWDTYRAAHPLYTLVAPERVGDIVTGMLAHRKRFGYLPVWSIWGRDAHAMIGNHAVPVILDAWKKGFAFDREAAYEAVKESLTVEHATHPKDDWKVYDSHGYYPRDIIRRESVSRTLECTYDDWCAAEMARMLGRAEDEAFFRKRADNWKNVFDSSLGFMRGRDSTGGWKPDFDPAFSGWGDGVDFVEGSSWQWTWHVLHDPMGLVAAMGGREKFAARLDALFMTQSVDSGRIRDVSGLIGQYAHGNEPSHHVIYFNSLIGRPDRTAELVREVCDRFYRNTPDGLAGNEDCGQMSAWLIFSSLGFYPFNPASGEYVLGAPQIPSATLRLPGGKTFSVIARGLTPENKYVKSVRLNGKPLDGCVIRHDDIVAGGELVFEMYAGAKPVWSKAHQDSVNVSLAFETVLPSLSSNAVLRLTGSSYYDVRMNGRYLAFGPARGPTGYFREDEIPLPDFLGPSNRLVITVAGYNADSFCLAEDKPFLRAEVCDGNSVVAATGATGEFLARRTNRFQKTPRYSGCRYFTEAYRIGGEESSVEELIERAPVKTLPRRAPYPIYAVKDDFTPCARERFRRDVGHAVKTWRHIDRVTLGERTPELPQRGFPQKELEVDVNALAQRWVKAESGVDSVLWDGALNRSGFPGVRILCEEPCEMLLVFDECLVDGTIDPIRLGMSNAAYWKIERPGEYELETFEPYTLRYLRWTCLSGKATLVGRPWLRLIENPEAVRDPVPVGDAELATVFEAARSTYAQNAVDAFTDCPSRERAAWLGDSFFIARANAFLTGNPELENAFFENYLKAESYPDIPEGMLPRLYPGDDKRGMYIPNWAMWFVLQLEEFAGRGGDREIVRGLKDRVLGLVACLDGYLNADGLLEWPQAKEYDTLWIFVEWSKANEYTRSVNYPSNMTYARVLDAVARLYGRPDLAARAEQMRATIRRQSFDGTWFCDNAVRGTDGILRRTANHTETCQYYAFWMGLATPLSHDGLWKTLLSQFGPMRNAARVHPDVPPSAPFIGMLLRMDLLRRNGEFARLKDEIKAYYGPMAAGCGTLWEGLKIGSSRCHGYAAHVAELAAAAVEGSALDEKRAVWMDASRD